MQTSEKTMTTGKAQCGERGSRTDEREWSSVRRFLCSRRTGNWRMSFPHKPNRSRSHPHQRQTRETFLAKNPNNCSAHFEEILNRPPPDLSPDIVEATEDLNINCSWISEEEIKQATKKLKRSMVPGNDQASTNMEDRFDYYNPQERQHQ